MKLRLLTEPDRHGQFFSITLPIITPTLLFNLITSIISSFQQVTLVMLLTAGGPMKSTIFTD